MTSGVRSPIRFARIFIALTLVVVRLARASWVLVRLVYGPPRPAIPTPKRTGGQTNCGGARSPARAARSPPLPSPAGSHVEPVPVQEGGHTRPLASHSGFRSWKSSVRPPSLTGCVLGPGRGAQIVRAFRAVRTRRPTSDRARCHSWARPGSGPDPAPGSGSDPQAAPGHPDRRLSCAMGNRPQVVRRGTGTVGHPVGAPLEQEPAYCHTANILRVRILDAVDLRPSRGCDAPSTPESPQPSPRSGPPTPVRSVDAADHRQWPHPASRSDRR